LVHDWHISLVPSPIEFLGNTIGVAMLEHAILIPRLRSVVRERAIHASGSNRALAERTGNDLGAPACLPNLLVADCRQHTETSVDLGDTGYTREDHRSRQNGFKMRALISVGSRRGNAREPACA
jgi:hypothetical protein